VLAEELGQGEAIAVNLREMFRLRVPIIATVIGEGGSGGALGIGVAVLAADREGLKTVLFPEANVKDLEEIPAEVRARVAIVRPKTAGGAVFGAASGAAAKSSLGKEGA
jgi:acetyl-CoA carboxylase carboxyl transferase subunit alpha